MDTPVPKPAGALQEPPRRPPTAVGTDELGQPEPAKRINQRFIHAILSALWPFRYPRSKGGAVAVNDELTHAVLGEYFGPSPSEAAVSDFDYDSEERAVRHARYRRVGAAAVALVLLFGAIPPIASTQAVVVGLVVALGAVAIVLLVAIGGFTVFIDSMLESMGDR